MEGEDRRKHLDFIQSTITRMSTASSTSKSWLLPVVTTCYGYGIVEESSGVALIGVWASILFMYLDANYLRQERQFRRIYTEVAKGSELPNFSLNYADVSPRETQNEEGRFKRLLANWLPKADIWLSWSILPFYGSLSAFGIIIAAYALM